MGAARRQDRHQPRLLIELKNESELAAVLGHEIVHAAARHGAQQMEKGQLMQIGAAVASIGASAVGGSGLGQVVGQGAALGAELLSARYGREDELEADHYGMIYMKRAGYDLQSAVSLQELFVRKFQAGKEQDWMTGLFASHPPSQERVNANRSTMAALGGPGGDAGTDRYAAAMAKLKHDAPAYEKEDQALAAAKRKDYASARRLTNEAVKIEPRESRFHGLLGDLSMAEENPRAAPITSAASTRITATCQRRCGCTNSQRAPSQRTASRRRRDWCDSTSHAIPQLILPSSQASTARGAW